MTRDAVGTGTAWDPTVSTADTIYHASLEEEQRDVVERAQRKVEKARAELAAAEEALRQAQDGLEQMKGKRW